MGYIDIKSQIMNNSKNNSDQVNNYCLWNTFYFWLLWYAVPCNKRLVLNSLAVDYILTVHFMMLS